MPPRPFTVHASGRAVPALAWLPTGHDQGPPPPVVLLGHGGSGHKGLERHHRVATRLVREHGVAALAIDGPFHGERSISGDGVLGYQQRVIALGPHTLHRRMVEDWLCALSVLVDGQGLDGQGLGGQVVDGDRVGFLGMSMGSRYGLTVCAELGSRLAVAVIGKFGLTSTDEAMTAMAATDLLRSSAAAITAPVLQHVQWGDEVFTREGQLELFDLFPSADKVLRARPGPHQQDREDDEDAWIDHLVARL